MTTRDISNRIRESTKKRVIDDATRKLRLQKQLEALEKDNYHSDPHGDLVMSKKIPKFQDNGKKLKERKKRNKAFEAFRLKYPKNFQQLLDEEKQRCGDETPIYIQAIAPEPSTPQRKFCAVCGYFSNYTCTACGTRYCCIPCMKIHQETRCLKWTV
ncbi:zinc finger HIT domain-containing protein 1-like [Teleopsis dalmanni]|uniref:zinc finger HIT domain-containing protein 1-like n=1 Tax=Teleopsis dalmanni TaxID=139649 RepID=UPI0018CD3D24|nr:zinc finger HIT domain-containing protein 1-like [Teleopsis dalmanni]